MIDVVCTCCARTFEGFAPTQANDCAADVHEDCVIGHYGSSVADMSRLPFRDDQPPEGLKVGAQICDGCITKLLSDGTLLPEAEPQMPFGDAGLEDPEEAQHIVESLLSE